MATCKFERYFKTVALCGSYFGAGMMGSIVGPTLLELQCALGLNYDDVVEILPARSSGFVIGSLIAGFFQHRFNPIVGVTVALTLMGICTILMPWASSLTALLTLAIVIGIGNGVIDNYSTVLLLYIWGKENPPYMQAFQLSFGLGSFVAPLLASPFLPEVDTDGLPGNESQEQCQPEDRSFATPYAIIGAFSLGMGAVFVYLSCFKRQTDQHPSRVASSDSVGPGLGLHWKKMWVILVVSLFMFAIMGLEIGMGSFITSFAVKSDLRLTEQVGAYMTSLYWAMITFSRLFVIALVNEKSIYVTITTSLTILVIANAFLVSWGNSVQWCLWVGVALTGMGVSPVWAATFSLLDSCFPVTSGVNSFLAISVGLGEWVYPVIMGYAVQVDPQLYLYTILSCTLVCCILFAILSLSLKATVFNMQRLKEPLIPHQWFPNNYETITEYTGYKLICRA
ncbi:Major facilitator superfamily domain-containing protein 4A [Halotydeus destructor]|nr:Major facilitator superfamily domain-containing protein 4A [Halotydeus destructor]